MSDRKKNTAAAPLDGLLTQIRACRICAENPLKGKPLPHEPRPVIRASKSARICVAGQAPGTRVHATGIPFNDPSGDRLRDWMGVTRDTFYDESRIAIVPMGFCFPGLDDKGGDLPPRKECAPAWRDQVFEHLPNLELVLLIGQYAQTWHLGKARKKSMTETVLHWRDYGPAYLPLPHPSWRNNVWLKKNLWFEEEVLPHLRAEVARLTR
ncbi:uracil-DNA glycosylase superfamily protein [Tepidicaulis marinus]|uniref:Uracil-DNA glycosylase superfamily protein n=1 Tax=Tepidicaulis marinus TaxID=1333998 RepID=A0A081BB03_9HYPH|nr:uracil-DNA glycosylase family protein [Tepidicaulis marinus]GAK45221.1 uracil-DNA glycosylase superfamily protein [Tepidicaulis marinus]